MQQFADALFEAVQVERLGEKILGVHGGGAPGDVAGERAHENDGNLFGVWLAAENFTNGQAVEVGQQNIEQDEIRFLRARLAQRVDAVVGHNQVVAMPREFVLQQLDEVMLVIHDQNPRPHAHNLACLAPNAKTTGLNPCDERETTLQRRGAENTEKRGAKSFRLTYRLRAPPRSLRFCV